jgi:uncharacterized metal-binding protein
MASMMNYSVIGSESENIDEAARQGKIILALNG